VKTLYRLIGVQPSATPNEIKHAFRREIARYHPDKVQHLGPEIQEIAATRAAELTEAYRILMNPAAREKYDGELQDEAATADAAPEEPAPSPAAPPPSAEPDFQPADEPRGESFEQTRATVSDYVRRATLKRLGEAVSALCDAARIDVAGFDAGYDCIAKRGFFKAPQPALRLLARLVTSVDAAAIHESWPLALRAGAADANVCIMLVGQSIAPPKELAATVAEHRRRSRNHGPPVVPVSFRDWEALFPPETPALVRAIVEHLRQRDR
jgi:hypothetical protein